MSGGQRAILVLGAVLALSIFPLQSAAAIGPYTFPFYDPSFPRTQPYGCQDDPDNVEGAFHDYNADGTRYDCEHFHNGADYDLNYDAVVASRAGTVVKVEEDYGDYTGPGCASPSAHANFVIIDHGDEHYSIYYHLKHDGVVVEEDDEVSAGQRIATSGNSGYSCGSHLHYQLSESTSAANAHSFNPGGKWTTPSGRVPFRALYDSNSGADVCYGETTSHWVKFKNLGGRTWSTSNDEYGHGRIVLYATTSSGYLTQASIFEAADWESSTLVTAADQASVAPDVIGTFTFGLEGNGVVGHSYVNYFNLRAYALMWFDVDLIAYDPGIYYVPIFILPHGACG